MPGRRRKTAAVILVTVFSFFRITAQISPGDLASHHSHLEGISNCTQCHVLGNKVSNEKCLICHKEIGERITARRGFHLSTEVKTKQCVACHSDHHGKNFQLVRLDASKFDHSLTGYPLSVPHSKKECKDCHNPKFIADQNIKAKKYTYLGVGTECLNCHADYHQKTLSPLCLNCHNPDAFKPATEFNHSNTKFPLVGKHLSVDCAKCHKVEVTGGKKFQEFRLMQYSCSNCHKDPHKNQFGQNCTQCHSEESFQIVKGVKGFDHNKTNYRLEGKHVTVNCKACHKTKFTDPLKHQFCTGCHADYHKSQFVKNGISPDCSKCHGVNGFAFFTYTVEQHNQSTFSLEGAHLATPCFECHKKQSNWNFKGIGINCKDCHKDVHQTFIEAKYYPESNCKICHNESRWSAVIAFNHSPTGFDLNGAHTKLTCRACHISGDSDGAVRQKFSGLSTNCADCHKDRHFKQFEKGGTTNCSDCHDTENWKASKFDHNKTAFRLDGKHINVPCAKCHKPQQEGSNSYVIYKLKDFRCESCHF